MASTCWEKWVRSKPNSSFLCRSFRLLMSCAAAFRAACCAGEMPVSAVELSAAYSRVRMGAASCAVLLRTSRFRRIFRTVSCWPAFSAGRRFDPGAQRPLRGGNAQARFRNYKQLRAGISPPSVCKRPVPRPTPIYLCYHKQAKMSTFC